MGRRKKVDILNNPTEFDFELRPLHILPINYLEKAIEICKTALYFVEAVKNPILSYSHSSEETSYYRFWHEIVIPPPTDILGRPLKDPGVLKIFIQTECAILPENSLPFAELFSADLTEFNNWVSIEIEYQSLIDQRMKKFLKYP